MIGPDDQQALLALARRALEARVRREPAPPGLSGGALAQPRAAFVSIHHRGDLRGCLGRLSWNVPLGSLIAELAGDVADSDPRFAPVQPFELPDLRLEISALSPTREIASTDAIEVGRHGLVVEDARHRGLLLPQVAVEHGWTPSEFVEYTCRKARVAADPWQNGARVLVFEAQVFSEP